MTVNPTDKFLVNRSGSSYHVEQQDLMAQLEDDDLLLVNRNSKSYKITGAEFKGSLSSPPVIQSVTLTEDDSDGARFTSQDFTTTAVMLDNGNPASTKSIRGWVEGSLVQTIETDVITELVSNDIPSKTWSDDVSPNTGGFVGSFGGTTYNGNATSIFDNSLTTAFGFQLSAWTIDFGTVIAGGKVEIAFSRDPLVIDGVTSYVPFVINGVDLNHRSIHQFLTVATMISVVWVDISSVLCRQPFSKIDVGFIPDSNFGRIGGLRVDGTVLTDGQGLPQPPSLRFATDKDLNKLSAGVVITQNDSAASGSVGGVDIGNRTFSTPCLQQWRLVPRY